MERLAATRTRTERKDGRKRRLTSRARGMPTSARGCDRATQERKLRRPIPGSITTGTAPSLNRANTEARRGRPCRTMTSVRSPRLTPALRELRDPGADFRVQGGKTECQVVDVARGGAPARDLDGGPVRLARGHEGQVARDVCRLGGHARQARASRLPAQGPLSINQTVLAARRRENARRPIPRFVPSHDPCGRKRPEGSLRSRIARRKQAAVGLDTEYTELPGGHRAGRSRQREAL